MAGKSPKDRMHEISTLWKNMSDQEKSKYKDLADQRKAMEENKALGISQKSKKIISNKQS